MTTPDEDPTVAAAGLLLAHVPPDVGSVNVNVVPAHNVVTPVIVPGGVLSTRKTDAVADEIPLLVQITRHR